jgi:hypothetical protein
MKNIGRMFWTFIACKVIFWEKSARWELVEITRLEDDLGLIER